jgi:hypothetical protein
MMTNTTQTNMVNVVISLTQVLSLAFTRYNNNAIVNKPQMPTEDHMNKPPLPAKNHINNIQMLTITLTEENDDD